MNKVFKRVALPSRVRTLPARKLKFSNAAIGLEVVGPARIVARSKGRPISDHFTFSEDVR